MARDSIRFHIRTIRPDDTKQLIEVEKDAFPTLWPPTPFRREVENKLATYLIAASRDENTRGAGSSNGLRERSLGKDPEGLLNRWVSGLRRLMRSLSLPETTDFILGYLGLWRVVDDSHIVSVGVRTPYRRNGIGEALLIRSIDTSMSWGVRYITLEVRVSNHGAQLLYDKYGFRKMGVRKRYYLDNNEDAYIMTTDSISTPQYQEQFQGLKSTHAERLSLNLQPDPFS